MSIRVRLTLWYSVVLAFGLILFALAVWVLLKHVLYDDLQKQLALETTSLQTFITNELKEPGVHLTEELEEYAHGLPDGTHFRFFDDRNAEIFATSPSFHLPAGSDRTGPYSLWKLWNQPDYLLLERSVGLQGRSYRIAGAISASEALTILHQLRILLITLMPLVVLIACFGGYLLSRRALHPVDEITGAAQILSIRDLSSRLPVARTGDELQRLSETWNSMLDRLEGSVQRLSRFTQDASHELRTPLAIIRSTAEIASRRSRSEASYRLAFNQIVEESDRLTALVENLLLLARGDGPADPQAADFDLSSLVAEVCAEMKPLARRDGIALAAAAPVDPIVIHGDAGSIRRLLVVLIDNAIKYSTFEGSVRVSLQSVGGGAELRVADQGIGIAAKDLSNIFERFYRGEAAREAWNNGAGLGLSLAASIAQQHNACIAVASEPEQGSIFTVTFPAPTAQTLPSH